MNLLSAAHCGLSVGWGARSARRFAPRVAPPFLSSSLTALLSGLWESHSQNLLVANSKNRKPRWVPLTEDGISLFSYSDGREIGRCTLDPPARTGTAGSWPLTSQAI